MVFVDCFVRNDVESGCSRKACTRTFALLFNAQAFFYADFFFAEQFV